MGHRRIKSKPSRAATHLAVRKILFPEENVDVPAELQPLVKKLDSLCRQSAETVDTQYAALKTCARMLDRLTERAFEYTGPSSQGIVQVLERIQDLRRGVYLAIGMMEAYTHLSENNSVESLEAIESYHDKVYGAMFEMLSECRDFVRMVTIRTPNANAEPDHPIWKIQKELENAVQLGPVKSESLRQVIKQELGG